MYNICVDIRGLANCTNIPESILNYKYIYRYNFKNVGI